MTLDFARLVKPLEWRQQSTDCFVAKTQFGDTAVQNESHALAPNRWGWWMAGSDEDDSPTGYADGMLDAAAAAQADHADRVLAALDLDALRGLVDALADMTVMDADNSNSTYLDSNARAALSRFGVTP